MCYSEATVGFCTRSNGGESVSDRVGADLVVNGSGAQVGAATCLFVKRMNTEKVLVACSNEWPNREFWAKGVKYVLASLKSCEIVSLVDFGP